MIGEQNSQESNFKNVSTKVPVWVAELLNIICKARGTDIYGLMQLVLQFIIETAKVNGPVPPQMQAILNMLKMDADWNKAFAFGNTTASMDVAQIILVLQQHDGKQPRQGFGLAMIDKPFLPGETPTMTLCVDDILERVAEVAMRGLYKRLVKVGVAMESQCLRETLTQLCDGAIIDLLDQFNDEEMPQVGNFHDFGKAIEYGQKHKRVPHRTPDSVANSQQRIRFDEDDATTTDTPDFKPYGEKADAYFRDLEERAKEEELGFKPHGGEW